MYITSYFANISCPACMLYKTSPSQVKLLVQPLFTERRNSRELPGHLLHATKLQLKRFLSMNTTLKLLKTSERASHLSILRAVAACSIEKCSLCVYWECFSLSGCQAHCPFCVRIFPCLYLAPTAGYVGREEEMDSFRAHPESSVKVCFRQHCDTHSKPKEIIRGSKNC